MAHQVTSSGFPVDPELARLENDLGALAAQWRGARGQPERQAGIVQEYLATFAQLTQLGWNADIANLEHEATLPDDLMPEAYRAYQGEHILGPVDEVID